MAVFGDQGEVAQKRQPGAPHEAGYGFLRQPNEQGVVARQVTRVEQGDIEFQVLGMVAAAISKRVRRMAQLQLQVPQLAEKIAHLVPADGVSHAAAEE